MKPAMGHSSGLAAVVIIVMEETKKRSLTEEILYGLEEEQLPYMIESGGVSPADLIGMAYGAATRSAFGVGICIGQNEIAIHYSKLPKEKPLFLVSKDQISLKKARCLGLNAARLVKGMPFIKI